MSFAVVITIVLAAAGMPEAARALQAPQARPAGQAQTPPATPPQTAKEPPADPGFRETVVVSASKTEQQLVDAPATMSVIGAKMLEVSPSSNYADLLRNVPGVNITQISSRDVNVTSRGAASSLATSQLAVLDGRSLYQDFFGFVMWDFMPANLDEIKRIEVIRGPASAVWGANALNGVINVITKSPREMAGTSVSFGLGDINREVSGNRAASGSLFFIRGTHAQAVTDRWAYRVSAGTYTAEALARPVGTIPNGTNTPYPAYVNAGTSQPKLDVRADYDFPGGAQSLQLSAGLGGTDGIMHTGIGPFDIDTGARMGYAKLNYTKNAFRLQAFLNTLSGRADNLVSRSADGRPIVLDFNTKTFDVEVGDTRLLSPKHVLTYGGNLRANRFDLSLVPGESGRTEGGLYVQDEMLLTDRYRIVAGARVDKFSSIDRAVLSPRVAFVVKPTTDQSVRVSYNRAFRAPSMVNNNLETSIVTPLPLAALSPAFGSAVYLVPTSVTGNPDLTEEHIDVGEVAYTANLWDRANVSAAYYYSSFSKQIFFTQTGTWLTAPPGFPGVPLSGVTPNILWGLLLNAGIRFPSSYSYQNLGTVKSQGLELGVNGDLTSTLGGYLNYSFQADPKPEFPGFTEAQALAEINLPSKHLFNLGVTYDNRSYFGSLSVSRSGRAFWQDVLDARFSGYTKAYTLVNLTLGARWQGGQYQAALKLTNVGNREVQSHIFGDVVKRQIVGEFKIKLPQ